MIVIPAAPKITATNIGTNSVNIHWNKHNIGYYPKRIRYQVLLREDHDQGKWFVPKWRQHERCRNSSCQIIIENLYSYWPYTLQVRAKSNSIEDDKDDGRSVDVEGGQGEMWWSQPTIQQFRTLPSAPVRAPIVPLGAFYIDNSETQLRLYWEEVAASDRNGPDFHYLIRGMQAERPDIVM